MPLHSVWGNNTVHLLHNPVHHQFIKENYGQVTKDGCQVKILLIIRLEMYGVVQNNTVHFRPCDLKFLLCPLLYDVVTLDSVLQKHVLLTDFFAKIITTLSERKDMMLR